MGDASPASARGAWRHRRSLPPDTGARRVVLLAVDAASLDFISPAVADGRLPNFGRLLDAGASMHLATLRPTQPGPVWTAVATGKLPWRNGVRSAATYRAVAGGAAADLLPDFCFAHALVSFGLLTETLQTSAALAGAARLDDSRARGAAVDDRALAAHLARATAARHAHQRRVPSRVGDRAGA